MRRKQWLILTEGVSLSDGWACLTIDLTHRQMAGRIRLTLAKRDYLFETAN